MKSLVVFLLVVLGCSLTDGRKLSRCELRDLLRTATANANVALQAKSRGPTVDDLLALSK